MGTTFLLIRHGAHLLGGDRIAGRTPDVHLSPWGCEQAAKLAERLGSLPIQAVYTSPMERTRETAAPLADGLGLTLQSLPELNEIDFGDWNGARLDDLRPQPLWQQWNAFRSGTRAPNGESMLEAQCRILQAMERLRERHPDEVVALVSHADVIKAAVAYFLGAPLDLFLRIEIGLASVTAINVGEFGPWVLCVNETGSVTLPY